jgi:hypothetical protein
LPTLRRPEPDRQGLAALQARVLYPGAGHWGIDSQPIENKEKRRRRPVSRVICPRRVFSISAGCSGECESTLSTGSVTSSASFRPRSASPSWRHADQLPRPRGPHSPRLTEVPGSRGASCRSLDLVDAARLLGDRDEWEPVLLCDAPGDCPNVVVAYSGPDQYEQGIEVLLRRPGQILISALRLNARGDQPRRTNASQWPAQPRCRAAPFRAGSASSGVDGEDA